MSVTVTVRPPREEEVAEVVRVINEASQAEFGVDDVTDAEIRRWFSQPVFDVERDAFLAFENGRAAGYADASNEGNAYEQIWIDLRLPPASSRSAGQALLAAAEARAEELAAEAPDGKLPRLISGTWDVNEPLGRLLADGGYRIYRHSWRMVIDTSDELQEPRFPEGIELRTFRAGDERAVFDATEEAFRDTWDHVAGSFEEWSHWNYEREDFDPSLWWLALDASEIAGFSLCRPHETEADMGWVSTLGVRRPWRRRGIARALLLEGFHEFRRRGFARIGLGVDADSLTGANLLYESAGMRPHRRYDLYEKTIGGS
jgi:mycothiol synthase